MSAKKLPTPQEIIAAAAAALESRKAEVDRLNVFPVPDGDTGTNMALTMKAVVDAVEALEPHPSLSGLCQAITHGSLMGARGNSGVILSQILRGLCDVLCRASKIDPATVAEALDRAVQVSYQAVRKPVEGTMLTVIKDTAAAVRAAVAADADLHAVLSQVAEASQASVMRTPELLPVLREAGVVDAGGFGLAVLAEGVYAALEGHDVREFDVTIGDGALPALEPVNDWDDDEYLYCTEFLLSLDGDGADREAVHERISLAGGSELVVGAGNMLKIHVHTDDPSAVLAYATSVGEVAEVHINNMRMQTAERQKTLASQKAGSQAASKPLGFVAVAVGSGLVTILESLGVDIIVDGGQTMNPSTADIVAAIEATPAESVIVLPNNKNIIMAAEQAREATKKKVGVVPTRSVPEAFAAMFAADPEGSVEDNVAVMTAASEEVSVGEVTFAVKDSKADAVGDIAAGQVIGIVNHEIRVVGETVDGVALELISGMADSGDTLTLLAGRDLSDDDLASISSAIQERHPSLDIETHRGEQPLYPLIMSVE